MFHPFSLERLRIFKLGCALVLLTTSPSLKSVSCLRGENQETVYVDRCGKVPYAASRFVCELHNRMVEDAVLVPEVKGSVNFSLVNPISCTCRHRWSVFHRGPRYRRSGSAFTKLYLALTWMRGAFAFRLFWSITQP